MATIRADYRDPALPVEARVSDLLARMTLAEKIAQIGSFWAFEVVPESGFDAARLAALASNGVGEITRLAGSTNLRPIDVATTANAIQDYLVEETRLGIPTIIHEECLHGLIAWAAPCFQQSIGAAASFDPGGGGRDGRHDPPADAAHRRPARPRAGPRRQPRPALGPHRGDLRRGPVPRGRARLRLHRGAPGLRPPRGRRRDRQAHGRPWAGRGRPQPGAGPHRRARAPRRAAVPVRGRGAPLADRERHAGLLRRGRRPVPRVRRAADRDPPRRVGLRRDRRLGLHRRRDDRHGPPSDGRPRRGGAAGARRRRGLGAAADRGLRPAARGGHRGRPGQRDGPRCHGRADAPDEVPAGPLRPAIRRGPRRGDPRRPCRGRGPRRPRARGAIAGPRQERRDPAARRGQAARRGHRARRRQRSRPARRLQPPRPHGDPARDAPGRGRPGDRRRWRGDRARGRRAGRPAHDPGRGPRVPGRRRSGPRPRHRDIGGDRRGAGRRSPGRTFGRCRDRRARRALGPDRRLDHRRVPRPLDPRIHRSPGRAARGRGRDRDPGRARGRERPAAGHRLGRRALRRRSSSPGCPATPVRMRSRMC